MEITSRSSTSFDRQSEVCVHVSTKKMCQVNDRSWSVVAVSYRRRDTCLWCFAEQAEADWAGLHGWGLTCAYSAAPASQEGQ